MLPAQTAICVEASANTPCSRSVRRRVASARSRAWISAAAALPATASVWWEALAASSAPLAICSMARRNCSAAECLGEAACELLAGSGDALFDFLLPVPCARPRGGFALAQVGARGRGARFRSDRMPGARPRGESRRLHEGFWGLAGQAGRSVEGIGRPPRLDRGSRLQSTSFDAG